MKARCKFTVESITEYGGSARTVKLRTIYDSTLPEDQAFTKATPSGFMDVTIDNPAVLPMFTVGAKFYVDLTPAETPAA